MMDSENGEVESHARDSEPSSSGPPSEVEARTEGDTERREESDISAAANQVSEELGTSSLSAANTSSSTLFFSPSCFHTPAAGSLRRFGGEEDTVFKTARSHLETTESPTPTRPRFRRLDGLRAPCFNVTGESSSKPLSQELNSAVSPVPLGQIPEEQDTGSPVKKLCVSSLAPGQVPISPRASRDSAEAQICFDSVQVHEFVEESGEERKGHEGATRRNRKPRRHSVPAAARLRNWDETIDVEVPGQEVQCNGQSLQGHSFPTIGSKSSDLGQHGNCLVSSKSYDDRVMSALWWLNSFRSPGNLPTEGMCMDVTDAGSLTTHGEPSALDELNRLLVAFNGRASLRPPCTTHTPYDDMWMIREVEGGPELNC